MRFAGCQVGMEQWCGIGWSLRKGCEERYGHQTLMRRSCAAVMMMNLGGRYRKQDLLFQADVNVDAAELGIEKRGWWSSAFAGLKSAVEVGVRAKDAEDLPTGSAQ